MFSRSETARFNTVADINNAVTSSWHVSVTVSRCLRSDENNQVAAFSLHNHSKNWHLPHEAVWVDRCALTQLQFEEEDQRACVLDWLASEDDTHWQQVPWSVPSWYPRVSDWIQNCVQQSGATMTGAPEQVRAWAISCILRVKTTNGNLYFKALPQFFGHEPQLVSFLAEVFPSFIADVVAINTNEHWILTREWEGPAPASKSEWKDVFHALRSMQQYCIDRKEELLALNCHDRRVERLAAILQPLVAELQLPQMRSLYGLTEAEASELARRIEHELPQHCARLARCGFPDTLVHGDFWTSNVIHRDKFSGKSPVIFDWTDASISHPFLDAYLLMSCEKDQAMKAAQMEAFIEVYSASESPEKVIAALEQIQFVGAYYYLYAFRNFEINAPAQSQWELQFLLERFARKILEFELSESCS